MTKMHTRFAPSPTGRLHLGHAASAFFVWDLAKAQGGTVSLRIEDIDTTRCRRQFEDGIVQDLQWLGFSWAEPIRRQSDHFDAYRGVVQSLAARGLAYRCFRTRAEIAAKAASAPHGAAAPFIGQPLAQAEEQSRLERGDAFAWRLSLGACKSALGAAYDDLAFTVQDGQSSTALKAEPDRLGDIIISRKDSLAAYHIAATHDDAVQGITHVIRGEDLIEAPHIQTLLQTLMGWPKPIYIHHPLILGPNGKRLAKRHKSETLAALRDRGSTPTEIRDLAKFK